MSRKIQFRKFLNRLTGFSTPVAGLSWNPPVLDVEVAQQLITFLEDRRVLYVPYNDEDLMHAHASILQIRDRLTQDLQRLERSSELAHTIAGMRAACRRFLEKTQHIDTREIMARYGPRHWWDVPTKEYFLALGELRAILGIHIAQIVVKYGIDIEPELAQIFPEPVNQE